MKEITKSILSVDYKLVKNEINSEKYHTFLFSAALLVTGSVLCIAIPEKENMKSIMEVTGAAFNATGAFLPAYWYLSDRSSGRKERRMAEATHLKEERQRLLNTYTDTKEVSRTRKNTHQ